MLSHLSDEGIDEIVARTELKRYTPYSIIDKTVYHKEILVGFATRLIVVYNEDKGAKNMNNLRSGKKWTKR